MPFEVKILRILTYLRFSTKLYISTILLFIRIFKMPHFNQYNVVSNTLVSSAHLRHSTFKTLTTFSCAKTRAQKTVVVFAFCSYKNKNPAKIKTKVRAISSYSTVASSKAFVSGAIVKKNSRLDKQMVICHGTSQIDWPKPFLSKFYLILAYKKTLRAKINQYFDNPATNYFFLASLPFIACLGQIGLADYGNKYARNLLLQDAFPAFAKPTPKISWETFNYLKYRDKLDLTKIDQIYYAPASAFIELNPSWFSQQNSSYVGTFQSKRYKVDPKNLSNWTYLPGRNLTNYSNSNILKKRVQNPWNAIFNNYDDIPSKLSAIHCPDSPCIQLPLQKQRSKSDQKLHDYRGVQPIIADSEDSSHSIDMNIDPVARAKATSEIKTKKFTYFSNKCFDLNKSQNFRDLKGFVGLNSTKRITPKNRLENSFGCLSSVDYFSSLFNRAFTDPVPNLSKQRRVQYNILNSLEIFGQGVKFTSQNDLTSNLFDSIFSDRIPKESFMQQKQALRTDLLNATPPSWLGKLYATSPGLSSRFREEFLEGRQFQITFFQQLEDHLVSKKNTSQILTLSEKENLGVLVSLPVKDCFNSTELLPPFALAKARVQKIAPLLKRKLTGYLHPDSYREEVSFQKLFKSPLNYTSKSQMYSYPKHLKIDYGSKSSAYFDPLKVIQSNTAPFLLYEQKQGDKQNGQTPTPINLGGNSAFAPIDFELPFTLAKARGAKEAKVKSNTFWGPSTSLTSEKTFFLSDLKNRPFQASGQPTSFLPSKTKPYLNCFPVLSDQVPSHRIKNPVKRTFINFGKRLKRLIGKSQISTSFEPQFNSYLSKITKTLTFTFPTDDQHFYRKLPTFALAKARAQKQDPTINQPTTNLLSNARPSIEPLIGLDPCLPKFPGSYQPAPIPYKTHWNYTQTNQLKPKSQKLIKVENSLSRFVTELREPVTAKSWGFLSQGGFIWIVIGLVKIFENEYRETVLNYLKVVSPDDAAKIKSSSVDDNYRVIRNSKFRFNDIVGSEYILPKFAQVILYLVNARHPLSRVQLIKPQFQLKHFAIHYHFDVEQIIPKGFLLVGPPGTGKTLLVKALAGEATVPVIIESGVLFQSDMEQHGGDKLKMLFKASKSLGPSLLFLDEIDKIGKKRTNMTSYVRSIESQAQMPIVLNFPYLQNPNLEISTQNGKWSRFSKRGRIFNPILNTPTQGPKAGVQLSQVNSSVANQAAQMTQLLTQIQNNQRSTNKQNTQDVMMLTQLLNQMDGLTTNQNLIVIGATNRPAILDPALTRPGRFDKVIYLDLPAKRKRFELFQFYSKPGTVESINWDYFAKQTVGLSAAHISAAMNRSLLKVIYENHFSKYWLKRSTKKIDSDVNLFGQRKPGLQEKIQKFPLFRKKQRAIHTFNSIESGIEMVSKTNIQTHLNSKETAKKLNRKLLGNFIRKTSNLTSYDTLILNSSLFYYQFATVLKNQKQLAVNFLSPLKAKKAPLFDPLAFARANRAKIKTKPFGKENQEYEIDIQPNFCSPFKSKDKSTSKNKGLLEHTSNQIKRQEFYTVHQKSLRTLAYFHTADQETPMLNVASKAISYDSNIRVRSDVKSTLPILRRYINRLIQNQIFGWHLLLNSTCLVKNDFFDQRNANYFSKIQASQTEFKQFDYKINWFDLKQKQGPKKRLYQLVEPQFSGMTIGFEPNFSLIYGNLCTSNGPRGHLGVLGNSELTVNKNSGGCIEKRLLKWKYHTLSNQYSLFGDELFICRSAYYLSGKCLMLAALPKKIHEQPFSLWSFITLGDNQMRKTLGTELFLSNLSSKLLTKIEFEFYLLFVISGKVSETLMLLSNDSKNDSNIGVDEFKTAGSIILAMITKYLFHSTKLLTIAQVNIDLFQNKTQIPLIAESTLLRTIAHLGEVGNQSGTTLPGKGIQRYDLVTRIETPWWQFQSFSSICSVNKRYGQWYRFYLSEPNQNPRNIEWVPPEKYYHNQMNNSLVHFSKSGQKSFCNTKDQSKSGKFGYLENIMVISFITWSFSSWYEFQFFKSNNTFLIFGLFNKLFEVLMNKWTTQFAQFQNLNWNSSQLLQEDSVTANFIFELFNKSFELFENNRELLDNFVYLILCHETIRDFEIENYYSGHFLKRVLLQEPQKAKAQPIG